MNLNCTDKWFGKVVEPTGTIPYYSYWQNEILCWSVPIESRYVDISIVIPAFNEERVLGKCLEAVEGYVRAKQITYEILVVDDGSTDDTASQLNKSFPEVILEHHQTFQMFVTH